MAESVCLNVTSHVDHRFGGITTSLPPFCRAIEQQGRYRSPIAAFCDPTESAPGDVQASDLTIWPRPHLRWLTGRRLQGEFRRSVGAATLVHIHGIWDAHSTVAARAAQHLNRKYIVSAHGMLDPWALKQKKLQKQIYSGMIERANLSSAACLRAVTDVEAGQYRDFGLKNPVAIIPNGVDVPPDVGTDLFLDQYPSLRGKSLILFLGRLHEKKGLTPLCEAWADVCKGDQSVHLVLAGPGSQDMIGALQGILGNHHALPFVTFTGPLTGPLKWSAYRAASFFVLPSHSEGFSIAVLESLASGTPVIVSKNCYFPDIESEQVGWILPSVTPEKISQTIRLALSCSAGNRREMGRRALDLVTRRYSWATVARQCADLYDWVAGGPPPGSCPLWPAVG